MTLSNIGERGRIAYRDYLVLDFSFILCFLVVMLSVTSRLANDKIKVALYALSILRALFDIGENGMLFYMLTKYPIHDHTIASLASWMTTYKFIAIFLWIVGIIVSFISWRKGYSKKPVG